ncbi:terminase large subunit [Lysinibacillus phage vB_LfM_LysYB1]|nr:terminase large subunit [Lysinibacillus phage vB_LfM_LysYB1]WAB25292.1 terminase large subunit [Lysinibacillus phage vB_LfM_LysYB2]
MTNESLNSKEFMDYIVRATPSLYLLNHYTIRNKPLTFSILDRNEKRARAHRPWQVDIVDDHHPDKVVRKSRQLGLSEMGVAEAIWFSDFHNNSKLMYTFPRARQMNDFVKTRMNPVFESNEYFKSILDTKMDSIEVKRIRDSFMMFRSAWGGAMGEGADIDFLAFDEYDRMQDSVELAFQEGMKSSAYGWLRRWSTPTIPGRGVDLQFSKSDQRFYMHKCEACNEWQILNYEDNIFQYKADGVDLLTDEIADGTFGFVCAKCSKPIDRWYNGEWVAKYPSRNGIRGYHISQLNAVWITADQVKRNELSYTSKQLFYNYVIGEPFAAAGLVITDDDILASQRFEKRIHSRQNYQKVVVGIDWGVRNWAVVLGIKEDGQVDLLNLFMFKDNPQKPLEPVGLIAASITPYNPDLIIADAGFGADRNTYLMQLFPGRTWACQYNTYKGKSKPQDSWNDASRLISVDKTVKVQRMLHTVKARGIGMWKMDDDLMVFTKHLKNVRIMDEEEDGIVYQVATRIGDDHWSSCLVYALIGVEKIKGIYQPKQEFNFDFL